MQSKLEDARAEITKQLSDMLSAFKGATQAGGGGAATQLAVPENLRFLPLLLLGLLKHVSRLLHLLSIVLDV
jgi:protein transport protein SEC24